MATESSGMAQEEFLPGYSSIDAYSQASLKQILLSTKYSNAIPGEKKSDWDYYDTFSGFRSVMSKQNSRLRDMIKKQFEYNGVKGKVGDSDVADLIERLSDANDIILERISMNLDEAAGIRRDADPLLLEVSHVNVAASGSWNNFVRGNDTNKGSPLKLLAAKNVLRPQIRFNKFIDNSSSPFQPRLQEKPHSMKPLSILVEYDDQGSEVFSHPYIYEIERDQPLASQLSISVAVKPADVDNTPMDYIESVERLKVMIKELLEEEIIGIDLEAHTYRSYLGITCLIQISTASKDYLIDPFPLWSELPLLNEITANPKIVKVLHGCNSDVDWLQRDFSVYLRNVFDTHQAGKILSLPRLSLAWLLSSYCGVEADKQYQLADWRIRPLPNEMIYYARQDTRYLIYLYTRLKNELISKGNAESNLLHACLHQSNDICKNRYTKPIVKEESHLDLIRKARMNLNNKQLSCLKEFYSWRDKTARVEDESVHYVLPNHMMLKICTELPREMQGIMACCNPVPPLVKQNLGALHSIILSARDKQLMTVDPSLVSMQPHNESADFTSNILQSPLDLSHLEDSGDLETVVKNKFTFANNNLLKPKPDLSVFGCEKPIVKQCPVNFVSPYQRYTLLKPYLKSLEVADGNVNVSTPDNENLRLDSIKQHFERLDEMTPKRVAKKPVVEEAEEEEVPDSSDDEVEPNKPYFEDAQKPYVESNEKIPSLREGAQKSKGKFNKGRNRQRGGCFKCGEEGHFARDCKTAVDANSNNQKTSLDPQVKRHKKNEADGGKKKNLKRKNDHVVGVIEEKIPKKEDTNGDFDYSKVDFKKFGSSDSKKKDFDPNADKDQKHMQGAKKRQNFNKRGNKSKTFKKP